MAVDMRLRWGVVTSFMSILASLAAAQSTEQCSCPDGRLFAIGAALFGQESARVIITGLEPDLPAGSGGALARCRAIQLLGQGVELRRSSDARPYLKRENLKRGIVRDVCQTKIRFAQSKKTYDFFADDGSAVTLDENVLVASTQTTSPPDLSEDLTGKDLLQLSSRSRSFHPGNSGFDQEDLKETAYVIVRRRIKTTTYRENGRTGDELSVGAGTLGRIEKRAGNRSEPLWAVELLPDSAPEPFWRSLAIALRHQRPGSSRVVLASSQIVEINHFLDQYQVEMTHFGDAYPRVEREPGTMDLPGIFARPKLALEENIADARASGALDSIQKALQSLFLVPHPAQKMGNAVLILDESGESPRPDLLRRQCFVQSAGATGRLAAVNAGVRIFRPSSAQVGPDYYAVDLEMSLRSDSDPVPTRVVCRFPLEPIALPLVDRTRRILSNQFEVGNRP